MSLNIEFQMLAYLKLSKLSSKEDLQKILKRGVREITTISFVFCIISWNHLDF